MIMKKIFTLIAVFAALAVNAQNEPQLLNGDFEDWSNVTNSNHAPNNWNSFETAEGTYASTVKAQQVAQSDDVRPGSTGTSSAKISSRAVKLFGVTLAVAQGNLTTGCINAGSTSATNKNNYNFSKTSDETKSMKFTGKPVAMKVWVKLVQSKVDENYPNARVTAVIHDAYDYITYGLDENDTEENNSHVVAKGGLDFPANGGEWQQITVPFDYDSYTNDDAQYIIINFSTNAYPGKGNEGDELYIDDIEMVYEPTSGFDPTVYMFEDNMVVTVNGESTEPMPTTIFVEEQKDGKYTLSLKNFILASGEDMMPVGTIKVEGIEAAKNADGTLSLKTEQTIMIQDGDMEGVEMWLGPMISMETGGIPVKVDALVSADEESMTATIDIDLASVLGQTIQVLFGQSLIDTMGINDITTTTATGIYDINGRQVTNVNHGIYIIKTADGKVKKVLMK